VADACEHGKEAASGSIKGGEFLDHLRDYKFLKKPLLHIDLMNFPLNEEPA
jgi:hypothetical protein